MRQSAKIEVHTDRATALKSLAERPNRELTDNNITLVLGNQSNWNSNGQVNNAIKLLKAKLKRFSLEVFRINILKATGISQILP